MVLYSASRMARGAGKIINRPSCGGVKKSGTAPSIGNVLMSSNLNSIYAMSNSISFTNSTYSPLYLAGGSGSSGIVIIRYAV